MSYESGSLPVPLQLLSTPLSLVATQIKRVALSTEPLAGGAASGSDGVPGEAAVRSMISDGHELLVVACRRGSEETSRIIRNVMITWDIKTKLVG